jgi:hypothetical protein
MPLMVFARRAAVAAGRHRDTFLMGLLGAALAIGSAIVLLYPDAGSRAMSPGEVVALFSIGVLVAVLAFLAFETYNAVVALRLRIDKAWANIDVALKQRHDMLPALVSAVRGLMQFEQDVLVDVTRARAAYSPTEPIPAQAAV